MNSQQIYRMLANNAYQHYSSIIAAQTPRQSAVYNFMTTLKLGCWVLETTTLHRWNREEDFNSIGRLIWSGRLPIHEVWESDEERPLFHRYTLIQQPDGNFRWWYNASFIRFFSDDFQEAWRLTPGMSQDEAIASDNQNEVWASSMLKRYSLSELFGAEFGQVIANDASVRYGVNINPDGHDAFRTLQLYPADLKQN